MRRQGASAHLSHHGRGPYHILQRVGFGRQRPAVVAHLLQELVHRAEVVLHGALVGRAAEVVDEDVGDAVDELQDEEGADLVGTDRQVRQPVAEDAEQVQPVAAGVGDLHHGGDAVVEGERVRRYGAGGGYSPMVIEVDGRLIPEVLADRAGGDATEVPLDQNLPGRRKDEERSDHWAEVGRGPGG